MKDRVLTSQHGQFELRDWDGQNRSGIEPWGDKVLVLVDQCCEKSGSIIIPPAQRDRQTLASTTGVLIAAGSDAFGTDKRAVGARVCFERYAGNEYAGMDGELYRLMSARSIGGGMGMATAAAKAKAA
jgi:co-chaperonin GroES (HSP10)